MNTQSTTTNRNAPYTARCPYCVVQAPSDPVREKCGFCVSTKRCPIPDPEVLGGMRRGNLLQEFLS